MILALAGGLILVALALLFTAYQAAVPKVDPRLSNSLPDAPEGCSAGLRSKIAWGVATSAYQVEGGWNEGGRSPSIWDTFSQTPGNVFGNHTGNLAADHYHLYKQDIKLMVALGVKHYRYRTCHYNSITAAALAVQQLLQQKGWYSTWHYNS
eukprot:GHUV01008850.1.p1 GENE.GHUV01008850.1~~GHUV01008850.1.p1  ORF type:complete len:152 (+),score=43.41 GHUV01008850.1:410-865(+)